MELESQRPWRTKGDKTEHQTLEVKQGGGGPGVGPFQFEIHPNKPAGNALRSAPVKTALVRAVRNPAFMEAVINDEMISQETRDLFQRINDERSWMRGSNANPTRWGQTPERVQLLKDVEEATKGNEFSSLIWVADANDKRAQNTRGLLREVPSFSNTAEFVKYLTTIQSPKDIGGYKKVFAAREYYLNKYFPDGMRNDYETLNSNIILEKEKL